MEVLVINLNKLIQTFSRVDSGLFKAFSYSGLCRFSQGLIEGALKASSWPIRGSFMLPQGSLKFTRSSFKFIQSLFRFIAVSSEFSRLLFETHPENSFFICILCLITLCLCVCGKGV